MKAVYLGIDIGSVSVNLAVIDEEKQVVYRRYVRSQGSPVSTICDEIRLLGEKKPDNWQIMGSCTTGSGRKLIGRIIGADQVKNEITTHAFAALEMEPEARTVLEIGGQDSKIILLRDGIVVDFAMNTVCAAGTGSFLDQQAGRLGMPIEKFAEMALLSENPTKIAGRCGVFAESDMIHKQQMGCQTADIVAGLCEALVRNYLSNIARGKDIVAPVVFQGGVAANAGIRAAFEKKLGVKLLIPEHYDIMGAIGAALVARQMKNPEVATQFKGFNGFETAVKTRSFTCEKCANLCEIVEVLRDDTRDFCMGGRCGRFD